VSSLLNLQTHTDKRGNLTVIEKIIPFEIKRIFYIYGVDNSTRGYHRHKKTIQAAIAIQGKCRIVSKSGEGCPEDEYLLDTPWKCLLLQPEDFHWMDNFSKDCILMVLASENFDKDDYIFTPYAG
jgi:hypothetical protein